jgi:hypothetical protein
MFQINLQKLYRNVSSVAAKEDTSAVECSDRKCLLTFREAAVLPYLRCCLSTLALRMKTVHACRTSTDTVTVGPA